MTIKLEFKVGNKKYKLYDYEASQLYNKLRNYFESVGAFDQEGNLGGQGNCVAAQKEIGFNLEEDEDI